MKKIYKLLGVSLVLLCASLNLLAQQQKLSGKVVDLTGLPMPGVNVIIKGTTVGTVTDGDGIYTIVTGSQDILVFSFIGYQTQEILPGGRTHLDIVLREDLQTLDEVVVIGYGTTKRKDVTGAISSVSTEDIAKLRPVTVEQALQGKVPGLVLQQISGQPGGAVSVQIRGLSSFGGGSPLYVIDGVIIGSSTTLGAGTNPMAGINPAEIESVDVLKDASATAIYGSQATNGVIVITTKRGKVGAPIISYEGYYGFQQLPRRLPVMNLQEYATFLNARNAGPGWGFDARNEFANPEYLGKGTDWQKELFRNAPMASHTISVKGGDNRTRYLFSGSYFNQEGIALGSKFDRISVRLNLDNETTNWLKMGTSLQILNIKENVNSTSSNVINTALSQTPDIAVQNADGSWGGAYNPNGWVNRTVNPYAIALINKDRVERNQLIGNAYAEISFTDDIILRNELTSTFTMATEDQFFPTYKMGLVEKTINEGGYNFSKTSYATFRSFLTYAHTFDQWLNVNAMAGHEAQLNRSESVSASRTNFPSNNVQVISSGDPNSAKNAGTKGQSSLESYFGRLNLTLYDKYLLTGNIRADGSSKFASANRWVVTYSGAFAWKIHEESFLKGIGAINQLKLRLGYGLTNNQNIRDNAYTSTLVTMPTGLSGISQLTQSLGNPYVEWERTKYANVGLDVGVWRDRINFSVDVYNRRTDGLLMQIPLPLYSGTAIGWSPGSLEAPYTNVGTLNNKGIDLGIHTLNVDKHGFRWKSDFTLSRNVNEVLKLNADGASLTRTYSKTVVGRSIGEFYGYQVEGVFATAKDFETHARPVKNGEPLPIGLAGGSIWYGDLMFKDRDGNGIIDERDQTFLGSPIPKFQLGFNNTFEYKNFSLNIFLSANYGNKVFNQMRINGENPGTSFGYLRVLNDYAKLALIDQNGSSADINNVYVVNPETRIVGLRNDDTNGNNRVSDKYVEDGSFIRCRNLSLGYSFPQSLLSKVHLSTLNMSLNVSNAFLITHYKGMDPEIGSWDPLNAGVDGGFYPQSRVYSLSVNMSLGK